MRETKTRNHQTTRAVGFKSAAREATDMGLEVSPQDGGRGRRIAAGIVVLLVLAVAGGFAWRVFRPDHLPTHAESREARSPDPWAELPEGWTELPPAPALHASAAIPNCTGTGGPRKGRGPDRVRLVLGVIARVVA